VTQLSKVKQNTKTRRKIVQLKKNKKTQESPTGLYELFLLTVPIEDVARWQYIKQFC